MKKLLSLLLVGVMSVMLLAGCGTTGGGQDNPASGSDETEKSISIAQSANFSMGFAPGVQSYETTYYTNNFYESLVEYRDGEYQPCLATDWTVSEDGLTYTFYLREDVQFNDGTAFNAEAVKLYFDNMKSVIGTSANYGQLDMLTTEITVDDEYTVSFHLSRPYYNVLNDLAMVMPRGILSAAAFNEDGSLNTEYLMTHTPGTGPYMFESVNETATEYTFVKNPNYWGEEPDVDRFTVKVIPESKVAAMRAGEVDFIIGSDTLDANSYQELSQTEGITGIISDFNFVTEFIALNDEIAPLDDQNVRTAIQMAIDKESIAQNIYAGLRTAANSVMPTDMPYCDATVTTPDYDMAGAIALLEDSGWVDSDGDGIREKDGKVLSFTITYPSTGVYDNVVLFFQKHGAKFTTSTIRLILRNPIYCVADEYSYNYFLEHDGNLFGEPSDFDGQHGLTAYNKTDQMKVEDEDSTFFNPKFSQLLTRKPISEWIVSVGRHEGFISSRKWVETQNMLDEIAEKYNRPHRKTNALLSGLMYCPICGKRLRVLPESNRWTNGKPRFKYACPGVRAKECTFKGVEGVTLDEFVIHSLSSLQEEHSDYYRQLLENRVASMIRTDQSEKEYQETKKAIERLNVDIAAQVRNLREADDALKRFIQDDIKELTDELAKREAALRRMEDTQSENQYLIHELNGMKKRLLSFEEFAKGAQPEALFTLVHSIVDRIYITTDGTKQKCQVYIKGCATEDYSDVLGAAGYIEEEPLLPVASYVPPMCDLDYYSICKNHMMVLFPNAILYAAFRK